MKNQKNNIVLVPSDFTEIANTAIDHGIGVAKLLNYKLCILHIINKESKTMLKKEKSNEGELAKRLQVLADDIKAKHKIETDFILKEGSIFTDIAEVAKEIGANMIVLGTHGKVGVQHLTGSYAIKVVTSSTVPVIVVQERGFGEGYKNIVLPIDISLESKQKVKWAVYLAKNFNSTVHIITMNETDEFLARNIKNNLEQIKSILEQNNINYTAKIAYEKGGNFVKQVIHYADSIKADMITIMTAPDRLLPTFIVDTKDEQTIFNNSQIPVLCLNPLDIHIQVIGL